MVHVVRICLFLLVNVLGFWTLSTMITVATKFNIFPQIPPGEDYENFKYYLLTSNIGMMVWGVASLASISYFFLSHKELRTWLLLAPMYCPFLYGLFVMLYFNYKNLIF